MFSRGSVSAARRGSGSPLLHHEIIPPVTVGATAHTVPYRNPDYLPLQPGNTETQTNGEFPGGRLRLGGSWPRRESGGDAPLEREPESATGAWTCPCSTERENTWNKAGFHLLLVGTAHLRGVGGAEAAGGSGRPGQTQVPGGRRGPPRRVSASRGRPPAGGGAGRVGRRCRRRGGPRAAQWAGPQGRRGGNQLWETAPWGPAAARSLALPAPPMRRVWVTGRAGEPSPRAPPKAPAGCTPDGCHPAPQRGPPTAPRLGAQGARSPAEPDVAAARAPPPRGSEP